MYGSGQGGWIRYFYEPRDVESCVRTEIQFHYLDHDYENAKQQGTNQHIPLIKLVRMFLNNYEMIERFEVKAGMNTNFLAILERLYSIMEKEIEEIERMDHDEKERMFQTSHYYKWERWRVLATIEKLKQNNKVKADALKKTGLPNDLVAMISSF